MKSEQHYLKKQFRHKSLFLKSADFIYHFKPDLTHIKEGFWEPMANLVMTSSESNDKKSWERYSKDT